MVGVCVTCLVLRSSTCHTMARFGLMELYYGVLVAVAVAVTVVVTVTMKMEL